MELFSPGHLIPLLIIAALVFFGWKQLPDMARSAGRSLRVFRTEIKGLADDDAARETKSALTAASTADSPPPPPPAPAGATGSWAWQPADAPQSAPSPQPAAESTSPVDVPAPDVSGKPAG